MAFSLFGDKTTMVEPGRAVAGRETPILIPGAHHVNGRPIGPPYPEGLEVALFGMGCFWGAERLFWQTPGVWVTAVGYAGGYTPNPTYEEVCSGRTGHAEVVRAVYDPAQVTYDTLLKLFWEEHDPTQGMRQGNDVGTQYRSVIGTVSAAQRESAAGTRETFQTRLRERGFDPVTTDILDDPVFYFAEDYHQQYLSKNPHGYCGLKGTGLTCPIA